MILDGLVLCAAGICDRAVGFGINQNFMRVANLFFYVWGVRFDRDCWGQISPNLLGLALPTVASVVVCIDQRRRDPPPPPRSASVAVDSTPQPLQFMS